MPRFNTGIRFRPEITPFLSLLTFLIVTPENIFRPDGYFLLESPSAIAFCMIQFQINQMTGWIQLGLFKTKHSFELT